MSTDKKITITKIDAVKSQIDTAIELFFEEKDSVSIHTLTCAAYEVLMDLGKIKGVKAVLKNPSFVQSDMKKIYVSRINEAENFFKHADRDPDGILTFRPQSTLLLLWDACRMYQELKPSTDSYLMKAIVGWCFGHDEEMLNALNEGTYKDAIKELRTSGAFEDKKVFLTRLEDAHWQQRFTNWNEMIEKEKEATAS